MELNEKLQQLRKQKGLTQEEVAQALFVSRTAVSKWESGRGYPNIYSLKALAKFFSVTIDELLSGEEILNIAEEEKKENKRNFCDLFFALLDCSMALLMVLPFFGQKTEDVFRAVPLLGLSGIQTYLKVLYFAVILSAVVLGMAALLLQQCRNAGWMERSKWASLACTAVAALLFSMGRQPYAASFTVVFLMIKGGLLIKFR